MARTFDFPITTNDQSIERVLNAGLPAALVFLNGAAAAALDAAMTRLAKTYAGQVLVVRVPLADAPQTAARFGVRSGPTLVTVRGAVEIARAENVAAGELEQHILYLLGKAPRPTEAAKTSAAPSQPVNVTDASFAREVMQSSVPVVVDFWAPWCGPCRSVAPVLDRLAHEMSGRVKIAKLNVDENPVTPQQYGVQGIPTMMIVKDGKVVDRWVGALPEPGIRSRLAKVL